MKATHHHLKLFSKLLILILLFQSCNIYRSRPVSVDRAVEFNRKVKLTTENNRVYKFKSLEREGEDLFGIARANSKAARQLAANIVEENYKGNFVKIGIAENSVQEVQLKNYVMSAIVPILAGVTILVGLSAIIVENMVINPW